MIHRFSLICFTKLQLVRLFPTPSYLAFWNAAYWENSKQCFMSRNNFLIGLLVSLKTLNIRPLDVSLCLVYETWSFNESSFVSLEPNFEHLKLVVSTFMYEHAYTHRPCLWWKQPHLFPFIRQRTVYDIHHIRIYDIQQRSSADLWGCHDQHLKAQTCQTNIKELAVATLFLCLCQKLHLNTPQRL